MNSVQVCQAFINEEGQCSEPLVWVEFSNSGLFGFAEFTQVLPALVGVLFIAWGIKQLLRLIFNSR